jgi:hypothetical protein
MFEYERLASRYGLNVFTYGVSQVITTPAASLLRVDVGFEKLNGNGFSIFRRYSIGEGGCVFGNLATIFINIMAKEDRLRYLINLVLDRYAYRIEWTGSRLMVRINTTQVIPHQDGAGGERLFSAVSEIAGILSAIDLTQFEGAVKLCRMWGPGRVRNATVFGGAVLPFICVAAIVFWGVHHSPRLFDYLSKLNTR